MAKSIQSVIEGRIKKYAVDASEAYLRGDLPRVGRVKIAVAVLCAVGQELDKLSDEANDIAVTVMSLPASDGDAWSTPADDVTREAYQSLRVQCEKDRNVAADLGPIFDEAITPISQRISEGIKRPMGHVFALAGILSICTHVSAATEEDGKPMKPMGRRFSLPVARAMLRVADDALAAFAKDVK